MNNMTIYNQVANTPKEAQKKIQAGRLKGFTDINPMWRIKKLTEVFGICGVGWKTRIIDSKIVEGNGYNATKVLFIRLALNIKQGDIWSDDIIGVGGATLESKESRGCYLSDEAEKMAFTDALGICCKMLGFSSDIYYEKDRTKYNNDEKEYRCYDCGKEFEDFEHNGKKYTAGQAFHMAESKNEDKKARCLNCRKKYEANKIKIINE